MEVKEDPGVPERLFETPADVPDELVGLTGAGVLERPTDVTVPPAAVAKPPADPPTPSDGPKPLLDEDETELGVMPGVGVVPGPASDVWISVVAADNGDSGCVDAGDPEPVEPDAVPLGRGLVELLEDSVSEVEGVAG